MWARAAVALVLPVAALHGQYEPDVRRPATAAEVIAGNIIIGGVTAAIRALFTDADPLRAFGIGALGGAVHLAGKNMAVEPAPAHGLLGLIVAGTGTSIVANGGRGVHPLGEVTIPFASVRLHVTPFAPRKLSVGINAFETAMIAHTASRNGLRLEWQRTFAAGTPVFVAHNRRIQSDDGEMFGGIAVGPVIVVSGDVRDTTRTVRHEMIHAHQHWFVQDAVGKPIEDWLRPRIPLVRRLPGWLEIGIVAPGLVVFENWVAGERGARRLAQAEAHRLEVR
jgi:hypothetical protein